MPRSAGERSHRRGDLGDRHVLGMKHAVVVEKVIHVAGPCRSSAVRPRVEHRRVLGKRLGAGLKSIKRLINIVVSRTVLAMTDLPKAPEGTAADLVAAAGLILDEMSAALQGR